MKMTLDLIPSIVNKILEKVNNLNIDTAKVIALTGDLGAGKTTLTQEIAKQLGIKENMISPTFVIMKIYPLIPNYSWKKLIHIDVYRLETSEELLKLGWEELVSNKENLIILEWPENVPECVPKNALNIKLSHLDDNTREIEF